MGLCVEREHCGSPSSALQGKKETVQNKIVSNTDKRILQVFSFHMAFNRVLTCAVICQALHVWLGTGLYG